MVKKFFIIFLITILFCTPVLADELVSDTMPILIEGKKGEYRINIIQDKDTNDIYVSLQDMTSILVKENRPYIFYIDEYGNYKIENVMSEYSDITLNFEPIEFTSNLVDTTIFFNSVPKRYYTFHVNDDLYMELHDIQLLFDNTMRKVGNCYVLNPNRACNFEASELEAYGLFDSAKAVLFGDITNDTISYTKNKNEVINIASTSKLMTFYILAKQISAGLISIDDIVTTGLDTYNSSLSPYSYFMFNPGFQIPLKELVAAMLILSSNESAVAIGEYCAGSETQFVKLMNETAKELGMNNTTFYNSSGLTIETANEDIENESTVQDMFRLISELCKRYPWVFEFTSLKSVYLPTLGVNIQNTNHTLYNSDEIIGLKTGTTWPAGYCLTIIRKVEIDGEEHLLLGMEYGTNREEYRFRIPEALVHCQHP